ncbi:hypothetical protein BC940DRAFT_309050 [Gongronella butleri]|nr:hypothetical protein BC940DRAFT_309050 [Gongronella butleri]
MPRCALQKQLSRPNGFLFFHTPPPLFVTPSSHGLDAAASPPKPKRQLSQISAWCAWCKLRHPRRPVDTTTAFDGGGWHGAHSWSRCSKLFFSVPRYEMLFILECHAMPCCMIFSIPVPPVVLDTKGFNPPPFMAKGLSQEKLSFWLRRTRGISCVHMSAQMPMDCHCTERERQRRPMTLVLHGLCSACSSERELQAPIFFLWHAFSATMDAHDDVRYDLNAERASKTDAWKNRKSRPWDCAKLENGVWDAWAARI